ncbi:hypothetical protein C8J56DRAFT_900301 [Mycena floridula]|nr:hypothetical protein C8J56DRAFT_900301 [Mycena floridula]
MARSGRKKQYTHISKQDRKSAKNWAEGIREEMILKPWLPVVTDAMLREYHTRIPWTLEDHEEPTLPLPDFDPNAAPAEQTLSPEELAKKQKRIKFLDEVPHLTPSISGHKRPLKARSGAQQFSVEKYDLLVASKVATKLSDDPNLQDMTKHDDYEKQAKDNAKEARGKYEAVLKKPFLRKPEDMQKAIDRMGAFFIPILEAFRDATGLQLMLVTGGPIPNLGGEIGTRHIIVGTDLVQKIPFNWWRTGHFKKEILGSYKEFLGGAYTEDEKQNAALPPETEGESSSKKVSWTTQDEWLGEKDPDDEGGGDDSSSSSSDKDKDDEDIDDSEDEEADGGKVKKRKQGKKDDAGPSQKKVTKEKKQPQPTAQAKGSGKSKGKGKGKEKEVSKIGPPAGQSKRPKPAMAKQPAISSTSGAIPAASSDELPSAASSSGTPPAASSNGVAPATDIAKEILVAMPETEVDFTDSEFVMAWMTAKESGKDIEMTVMNEATRETPIMPADAAEWFEPLFTEFTQVEVDKHVDELLGLWVELERLYGWEDERTGVVEAYPRLRGRIWTIVKLSDTAAKAKRCKWFTSLNICLLEIIQPRI